MNCEQAANLLSARLDREIVETDPAALDAHLAACPGCSALADLLAQQHAQLTAAFTPRRLAADALASRVVAQLRTTPPLATPAPTTRQSWWASWGRPLVAAAAGFALALLLTRPWGRPDALQVALPATIPATTTATAANPSIAHLALATGEVFVCPSNSDQWRPLASGGNVQAGAKVRTGPKALCEFTMNDGSQVRMNTDTQLTLADSRRVEVTGGQVFSSVRGDQPLIVKTAPSQATLTAAGTAFDVSCTPASTICTVVEGSVKMEAGGNQNTLRGGETITLAGGSFSEKKQVENLMQVTQWVDEILVLKGRDNPELARRIDDIFAQLGHEKMWYLKAQEVKRLGDHCVIPLVRYIESDRSQATQADQGKRRQAASIVGDVAPTWAIPELINLLADTDGDVRYPAAVALQRLTGQTLGRRPEDWRDQGLLACAPSIDQWHNWWAKNKSNFPGSDPDALKPIEFKGKL